VVLTAINLDLRRFDNELRFRGDAHTALTAVLTDRDVQAGLRCGPLTLPNHKLVPDARWVADLPFERVHARAQIGTDTYPRPRQRRGVWLVVIDRFAIFKQAYTNDLDPATIELPPGGWELGARSGAYAAYVRC
jgi:hypothetical protein